MAAEEVTRTKLFVNTEWTAETCPATIDGVALEWGVNAFNDAFAAIAVARELTSPVEINMTGETLTTNSAINFVPENAEAFEDGWKKTNADILFTGTGTVQGVYIGRGKDTSSSPKGDGQTITIAAGTTVTADISNGQISIDGNTINVYGTMGTEFLRIAEHGGGELNIYSGGVVRIGYISASGSNNAETSPVINVTGDGKAYGNAQLIFTISQFNTDNAVDNAMVINVTDYGVMSLQRRGDSKSNYFVVRGDQQLNLTNGKLEYATGGFLTVQGKGKFSMSGASTAEVTVMNVNDTASVVIDANSSLSVTESLTIASGASFSIDFTNYDFTKVSGNQTILSAGAITGNVAVIGGDKLTEAGYSLVNNGTSVMITDTDITDLYVDPSLAGTEQGAVVMVGDKKKYFGVNAFDAVQGAVDAVSVADINGKYTITLNNGDEMQTLTGSKDADTIWGGALLVEDFGGRDVTITGNGIIETSRHEGAGNYTNKSTFTVITSNVTIDKGVTYSNSGHLVTLEGGVLDLYGKITDNGTSLGAGFYVMGNGDINIYDGGQLDYHCSTGFNYCGDITVYGNKDADSFSDLAQLYLHEGGGKLALGGNFEGRHGAGSLTVTDNGYALLQGLELGGSDRKTYTAHTGTLTLDNGKAEIIDAVVLGAKGYGGKAMGAGIVDVKNGSVLTAKSITLNDAVYTIPADAEAGTDEVTSTTASSFKQDGTSTVITDSITVNGTSTYTIDMTGFGGEGTDWSKIQVVLKADAVTGNITVNNAPTGTAYTYVDAKLGESGRVIYAYDDAKLDKNTICVTAGTYAEGDLVWANDAGYIFGTTAFNDLQTALDMASANGKDVVTTIAIDGKVGASNYGCSVTAGNAFITGNGTIQAQWFGRGAGASVADPHSLDSTITIDSGVTVEVMGDAGQFSAIGTNYEIYGTVKQGGSGTLYSYLNLRDISAEDSSFEGKDKTYVTNIYEGGSLTVGGIRTRLDKSHYEINVKGGTFSLNSTAVPNDNKNFKGLHLNVTDGGVVNMNNADYSFLAGSGEDATAQFTADNGTIDAANTTITFDAGSYFSLSNGSTATVKGLVFNTTGNTIDASSALTYTGAITVAEGASFTVDFTGFEAAEGQVFVAVVDGSASTGGITGKVDIKGELAEGWKVVQGNSIYAYDTTKVSTANLVVNADWADDGLAFGATVTVNGVDYLWGLNAFATFDEAMAVASGDSVTITNAGESPCIFVADQGPTWQFVERSSNVIFSYTGKDSYLTTGSSFYTIDASKFSGGLTLVGDFAAKQYTTWDPEDPEFADLDFAVNTSKGYAVWENTWNAGCGTGTNLEIKGNVTLADGSSLSVVGANSTLKVTDGSITVSGTANLKTSNFGAGDQSSVMNLVITEDTDPKEALYTMHKLNNPASGTLESWFYGTPEVKINVAEGVEIDGIYKVFAYDESTSNGKVANLGNIKWTLDQSLVDAGYQVNVAPDGVYLATLSGIDLSTIVYDADFASAKFGDAVQYDGKDYVFGVNAFATYASLESGVRAAAGDGSQKITVVMNSAVSNPSFNIGNGYKVNVEFVAGKDTNGSVEMAFPGNGNNMNSNSGSIITIGKGVTVKQQATIEQTNLNWRNLSELHIYGKYQWYSDAAWRYGQNYLNNVDVTVYDGGQFEWVGSTCWNTIKTLTVKGNNTAFATDSEGNPVYGWNVYRGSDVFCTITANKLTVTEYGAARFDQLNNVKEIYIDNGRVDTCATKSTGVIKAINTLSITGNSVVNVYGISINETAVATLDVNSRVYFTKSINGAGTLTVDCTNFVAPQDAAFVLIADGAAGSTISAKVAATGTMAEGWGIAATGNDILAYDTTKFDTAQVYVNATWTGEDYVFGKAFTVEDKTYYYGLNAFASVADAVAGADRLQKSVTITNAQINTEDGTEVPSVIANNATLNFVGLNEAKLAGQFTGTNFKISGNATLGTGADLKSTSGTLTVNADGHLSVVDGGTLTAVNLSLTKNGAKTTFSGGKVTVSNTLTVNSANTLTVSGGTYSTENGYSYSLKNLTVNSGGNFAMTGGEMNVTTTFAAKGNIDITGGAKLTAATITVDATNGDLTVAYDGQLVFTKALTTNGKFNVDFTGFDADAMDGTFSTLVSGAKAISGDVNYVGSSDLINAGWNYGSDGTSVFIYDQIYYGTDIYVNTDWAEMGTLDAVEGTKFVIGINAYGSIEDAVGAGYTTIISQNVITYAVAEDKLTLVFDLEGDEVINSSSISVDAISAEGKSVTAGALTLNSEGKANVSRVKDLTIGDADSETAAVLALEEGEKLYLSSLNVVENATIEGSGIRFSGKGASVSIAEGTTLTMTLEQFLAIQGVDIIGAAGSVVISDMDKITASLKEEIVAEYGDLIAGLVDAEVSDDPPTDVTDLKDVTEGYVGEVGGTQGADKLVIGKGEAADYSGIDYNMKGGKNVATINADADFAIGDLTNVSTVDVKAGSKTGVTKATFGDITTSAGAGAVKVGNNVEFSADSIAASELGGTNTVSFGNNVNGIVNGNVTELKSLALGNGSDLNVSGNISSDNTTFASAALKVGNDSTITAGDVTMNSVTLGKNVTAELGGIYTAKAVTIGANNTVSIDSIYGAAVNGAINAGNDSVVEIADDVNMRGGKNSIATGKGSDWTIGSDVMNVNTLTATAAGNWAWNADKTAYTLQRTTLNIGGDFLAGEGAAVLNFGNYSIVNIGGSILESDLGSSFKITVGSNAEVAVGDVIQSLNSLTIGNGVDFKTFTVVDGKAVADADKAIGTTVFSAGKVTGTAGNDTIKVGNKADVMLGKVSLGAGNDTINIGKDSTFEAADVALGAGKNTVVVGAGSWMNVDDISGVNKLTAAGQLSAGDITGTDDFADVVTFNGNAEIGSIDLGTDAKGKMSDKLVIGKGAEVVINGGISNVEALTIGADAKVSASESTIAAMMSLGSAKGSKIDASVEFVALDDAADNAAESTTVYGGSAEAWLGIGEDIADVFTLGDGTDLTGWAIEGEGVKVDIYTTTGDGNWTKIEGGIAAGEDGMFTLGDYTAEGVTAVKVGVSLENSEDAALTKYKVTIA